MGFFKALWGMVRTLIARPRRPSSERVSRVPLRKGEKFAFSTRPDRPSGWDLDVSKVRISLRFGEEKLKAFVSITSDDVFVVKVLKVIQWPSGLFVAMPTRRRS